VTAIFWIARRSDVRSKLFASWNPRDLPRIGRRRRATWPDNVAGIVVQTIFLLWWLGLVRPWRATFPVTGGGELRLAVAPIWSELYWPVAALAVGVIVVHSLKLMGPARRRLAYGFELALQLITAGVAAIALRAGHWAVVSGVGLKLTSLAAIDRGVNIGLHVTLVVVLCVALATVPYDAWRLWRPGRRTPETRSPPRNPPRGGLKASSSA
jgi:hypothetical protein